MVLVTFFINVNVPFNSRLKRNKYMKTYKNLWDQFISKENFELACHNSQKGKKKHSEIIGFNKNKEKYLEELRQLVIHGKFHTSIYRHKTIYEPKEREIYILPYNPDRIVQHAVMNILQPIFLNLFIENTYSCIEGRGQYKAGLKCSEYVRKYDYCLKCDIKKFYPSINQQILSDKLRRKIKDKRFMKIVDDIVFSFPGETNCPIGNYTSQWFGNYYLSFLDNYVLHNLKCGSYERYCDDFMLFSNDKSYLHKCKHEIEDFLQSELSLEYSKAQVFHTKQGVDFCGYRYFKKYILLRKSTSKRLKKRMKKIEEKLDKKDIELDELKFIQGQLASAKGLLRHACTYNLRKSIHFDECYEKLNFLLLKHENK